MAPARNNVEVSEVEVSEVEVSEVEVSEVESQEVESQEVELTENYPFSGLETDMSKVHGDILNLLSTSNYLTASVLAGVESLLPFLQSENFLQEFGHIKLIGCPTGKTKPDKLNLTWNDVHALCQSINVCANIWGKQSIITPDVDLRKIFAKKS